jgi:hypothetical protein
MNFKTLFYLAVFPLSACPDTASTLLCLHSLGLYDRFSHVQLREHQTLQKIFTFGS